MGYKVWVLKREEGGEERERKRKELEYWRGRSREEVKREGGRVADRKREEVSEEKRGAMVAGKVAEG